MCCQPRLNELDRSLDYYQPYATSHDDLDKNVMIEVQNAAIALSEAIRLKRSSALLSAISCIQEPRAK